MSSTVRVVGRSSGADLCRQAVRFAGAAFFLFSASTGQLSASQGTVPSVEELRRLSIEELSNVEVTSVFKRPEPIGRTPASIYVITREDIRRSGALTLPDALRLAPNLTVARRNAREYAISARGFNWFQLSNKLLVLIDGRSIYTPLHAGVFWDQQQVMVEDIERIEVISGPAGTLWGANAVNGVINVITRSAQDSQGGLAAVEGGTETSRGALRYGGSFGERGAWRAYGMGFDFDDTETAEGFDRADGWRSLQAGFRTDWAEGANSFTLQGDLFDNDGDGDFSNGGGNILGRWNRRLGESSSLSLQAYYDAVKRDIPGVRDRLETFDIEARHNFALGERHEITWGGGFRHYESEFDNQTNFFVLDPTEDSSQIANVFAQDSFSLMDSLTLTFGAKVEHSSYSGTELMPSARLAWQVADSHLLWAAVSRAVRTPSRIDRELEAPGLLEPAEDDFGAEDLIAYELGYKGQPTPRTTLAATLYYHDYDDLRVIVTAPSGLLTFANAQGGYTAGLETWGEYRASERWRLMAGLNLFRKDLDLDPEATAIALVQHQGNDPEYQVFLRSFFDLTDDLELDVLLRLVDDLPSPSIPSYAALDVHLGWQVTDSLQLSMVGMNLLDSGHPETGQPGERGEIPRSFYVGARWRF